MLGKVRPEQGMSLAGHSLAWHGMAWHGWQSLPLKSYFAVVA